MSWEKNKIFFFSFFSPIKKFSSHKFFFFFDSIEKRDSAFNFEEINVFDKSNDISKKMWEIKSNSKITSQLQNQLKSFGNKKKKKKKKN